VNAAVAAAWVGDGGEGFKKRAGGHRHLQGSEVEVPYLPNPSPIDKIKQGMALEKNSNFWIKRLLFAGGSGRVENGREKDYPQLVK
jgi:hypothetical protein